MGDDWNKYSFLGEVNGGNDVAEERSHRVRTWLLETTDEFHSYFLNANDQMLMDLATFIKKALKNDGKVEGFDFLSLDKWK